MTQSMSLPLLFCKSVIVGLCGVGRPLRDSEKLLMVPFHVGEVDGFVDDMVDEALEGVDGWSLGFHAKVSWGLRLLLAASFRKKVLRSIM